MTLIEHELVEGFAALDSTAVSDALDAHGLPGGFGDVRPVWGYPRVAGVAATIQLGEYAGGRSGAHIGTAAVDAAGPHNVLVVANDGRTDVSSWGGLLSLGASRRGVRGVVIDGACRDVPEARELEFPVYALASVPTTARGRLRQVSHDEPVQFRGVTVRPGDIVVADETGIVFVPREHAGEVLGTAQSVARREQQIAADILQGASMQEAMLDARLAGAAHTEEKSA